MVHPIFKDGFLNHAIPLRQTDQAHDRSLHIRRKARMRQGFNIGATTEPTRLQLSRSHLQPIGSCCPHLDPHGSQLGNHWAEVVADHRPHPQCGSGNRPRQQKGTGLDPIWDHAVIGTMQPPHPLNQDPIGAIPLDLRPHRATKIRQIHHLRLLGSIFNHGFAICQHCRHHQGFSGPNAGVVQIDPGSFELASLGFDNAMLNLYHRPHRL